MSHLSLLSLITVPVIVTDGTVRTAVTNETSELMTGLTVVPEGIVRLEVIYGRVLVRTTWDNCDNFDSSL